MFYKWVPLPQYYSLFLQYIRPHILASTLNFHKHKKQILKIGTGEKKRPTYWTKAHVQVHMGILVNKQIRLPPPPNSFLPILGRKLFGGLSE